MRILVTGATGFVGPAVVRAARRRRAHGARARAHRGLERRAAEPGGGRGLDDRRGEPARRRRGAGRGRPPRRDHHRQAGGVPERDGAGHARPARGRARRRCAAVRADVRARDDRGDEGARALLRREVADGAGREGVRPRARDPPAELRLRTRGRRARPVQEDREAGAGDADRRAGDAADPADLGRGRGRVLRRVDREARGREPDVRARRPGCGHLERVLVAAEAAPRAPAGRACTSRSG